MTLFVQMADRVKPGKYTNVFVLIKYKTNNCTASVSVLESENVYNTIIYRQNELKEFRRM